jgi:hypothetical protein
MRYAALICITILANMFNAAVAAGLVLICWGVQ